MGLKNRLLQFIEYKGITVQEFEKRVGLSNASVSKMGDNTRTNTLDRISNSFPELNVDWLRIGVGDMLNSNTQDPVIEDVQNDMYYTYLIPMSAMGGSLAGFDTKGVCPADCEKIVTPIAGVDFAISVYGESMYPEFPSGSRVLIKRIDPTIYIDWGNVFVLDTTNGIILKEVQPSEKEGTITCHSLNPNGKYKDFEVPLCEVRAMYKVLACVSLR